MKTLFAVMLLAGCAATAEPAKEEAAPAQTVTPIVEAAPAPVVEKTTAQAVQILCTKGKVEKKLEVTPAGTLPCKVMEGQKVLYNANKDAKFCETKFAAHKAKMEKLGYVCK